MRLEQSLFHRKPEPRARAMLGSGRIALCLANIPPVHNTGRVAFIVVRCIEAIYGGDGVGEWKDAGETRGSRERRINSRAKRRHRARKVSGLAAMQSQLHSRLSLSVRCDVAFDWSPLPLGARPLFPASVARTARDYALGNRDRQPNCDQRGPNEETP